jgi:2-polyprenyl-3-methyl-5-hydroxy-6-metoxy-1,4-benzoquinol methylase
MTETRQKLIALMSAYHVDKLINTDRHKFRQYIEGLIGTVDSEVEGYNDPSSQRDLSIKFYWGGNIDFGDFSMNGLMGDRAYDIITRLVDDYGLPIDLAGKRILDIGVWTGATSLLLAAMGGEVHAIEEVVKYAQATQYIANAFAANITVEAKSLYDLNDAKYFDQFDYVIYAGVIYHVSDPLLSLRIVYNALRDGGACYVESAGIGSDGAALLYEGPSAVWGGSQEALSRRGWNFYIFSSAALRTMLTDSGFIDAEATFYTDYERVYGFGRRDQHRDLTRAGLSVRNIR